MNDSNENVDDFREQMRTFISGYLDDELQPEERTQFERYVEAHPDFRREIDDMRELVRAASGLGVESVPDEVWDTFLDSVYNRLERRTGWTLLILGVAALAGLGLYLFAVVPWAPYPVKVLTALPVGGLVVLFASVLRQRLFMRKDDRYSRDIKR